MTSIERSIVIPAPAAIVWAALTDTGRYGSWNPFIPELTGELRPGAKIRVRISPPGGRTMSFTPTVTVIDEGRRLEWLGHLSVPGLFDGRHTFTLEPVDADSTRLTQAERFTGCLVPFTGRLLRRTAAGFEEMNHAIAAEAVARFAAPGQRHAGHDPGCRRHAGHHGVPVAASPEVFGACVRLERAPGWST